ncbi:small lysine-rich protein 1 isoform 1-T1 [Podargus strigoides]
MVIQAGKSSQPKRGKGKHSKLGKGKRSKKEAKVTKEVDILSSVAVLNAYYVCHNAPDCLEFWGFHWPGSIKEKGKRRK